MVGPKAVSFSLVITGIFGALLTIAGYGVENTPLTPGQPELVTAILIVTTLGFVVTGIVWRRGLDSGSTRYRLIPAVTLALVGIMAVLGSFVVFQPWASRGFGRTVTVLITGVLSILGACFAVVSYRWYRQQELRYPLALLTGILSVGLFHRFAQEFDPSMPVSIVALIVVVIAVVPVKGVLHVLQPESDT
jgi:hypothetical protein